MTIKLHKQLITKQDLVPGHGKVQQRRNGQVLELDAPDLVDNVKLIKMLGWPGTGHGGKVEDYAADIEITQYNQLVRDAAGEFWRLSGSTTLPYITTGEGLPEGGSFVAAGGAAMVAVDSIAELLALPSDMRKEGLRYSVKGYHSGTGVGGGEFLFDPARLGEDDGVVVFQGFVRILNQSLSTHDAGIRDGDVTERFSALASAAFSAGLWLSLDARFTTGETVKLSGAGLFRITGTGEVTQTAFTLFELTDTDYLEVSEGVTFKGGNVGANIPDIAFRGRSIKRAHIAATFVNTRVILRSDGTDSARGINYKVPATFRGDFTGAGASDTSNVLDVRGVDIVDLSGSDWDVTGPERFIKTSGSVRLAIANGIKMRGSCQKQLWDAFADTKILFLDNYDIDVHGATCIVDNKQTTPEIIVNQLLMHIGRGNVKLTSDHTDANLFMMQGPVGLAGRDPDNNTKFSCVGCKGRLEGAAAVHGSFLSVRGVKTFSEYDNQFTRSAAPGAFVYGYEVRATQSINLGKSEVSGGVFVIEAAVTSNGGVYSNPLERFYSTNLHITDYNSPAAFTIDAGNDAEIHIKGGSVTNSAGLTRPDATVRLEGGTVKSIKLEGVEASPLSGRTRLQFGSGGGADNQLVKGNSWQRGTFLWHPGDIPPGGSATSPTISGSEQVAGHPVAMYPPYDLNGLSVTYFTSPGGDPRAVLRNTTEATITIGEGLWRWEAWRQS